VQADIDITETNAESCPTMHFQYRLNTKDSLNGNIVMTHTLFILLVFFIGLCINCSNSKDSAAMKSLLSVRYLKIAHRGASGLYPENTLSAFSAAVEQAADMVELDVHLSADSQLVVIHDETVDRTTNGSGEVASLTLPELSRLDAGGGEKIPALSEVLLLTGRKCGVNIELKSPGTAAPVDKIIRQFVRDGIISLDGILVSSFDHAQLAEIKRIEPSICIAPLFGDDLPENFLDTARSLRAWSVNLNRQSITADLVKNCHKEGVRVLVYTVNDPEEIARLKSYGADGIIGNYPDRL
jgi:glycerophosphoryl diester phosphodiesterase